MGSNDPFKMLGSTDPSAQDGKRGATLVVVGARRGNGKPGFVLLSDQANGSDHAAGEELLDHSCSVLAASPRAGATGRASAVE